jgi:hypothetical protein
MGYELIFHYKESSDSPGIYNEEIKNKSYKVGKVTEEVNLEIVAGKILSQLARRNILIVDVEIYEYAKKKLNYRETKDGIVIKNKKFSFDSSSVSFVEDFDEGLDDASLDDDFKPIPCHSKNLADKSCSVKSKNLVKRSIRQEVFDPDPIGLHKVMQKGLKFTSGKKYPIYAEESMGSTIIYSTIDDSGKEVKISSQYFVAIGSGLFEEDAPKYVGAENQKDEINLWSNYEQQVDMPDIRRK